MQRALTRDVAARYDSAQAMATALRAWLNPEDAAVPEAGNPATLEFLLRRMRHKTEFPALSASIVRIQKVTTSETESLTNLTDEILNDVALTNKLLRMVNTAHFSSVAGGGVATVSRAVAMVGFAGIRNMALSVVLLEHMRDKAHAALLKEEFLRALMAGTLADELTPMAREGEEAFLGAMFQNLGRLLTECYLPEEAVQIRQAIHGRETTTASQHDRETAARRVLGLSLDEMGCGVAKAWGLPAGLQRVLHMPEGETPTRPVERGPERLRWLARGANAMADAMLGSDGDAQAQALQQVAELYAPALDMNARDMVAASYTTRGRLRQLAQAMAVHVAPGAPARRLLEATLPVTPGQLASALADAPTRRCADAPKMVIAMAAQGNDIQGQLARMLDEVRAAVVSPSLRLGAVLQMVLDTIFRVMEFQRVVLCLRETLRETGSPRLVGRVGLGPAGSEISAAFPSRPTAQPSATSLAGCAPGVPTCWSATPRPCRPACQPGTANGLTRPLSCCCR